MTDKSLWQTESLAKMYLQSVRGAIPAALLQLNVIKKIISVWYPQPDCILDLGCGDGLIGRMLLEQFPGATVIFADFSNPMLEAVRKQVDNSSRAVIVKADFSTSEWLDAVAVAPRFDAIVSGFAIHHQSDQRKRELYGEIFEILNSGGVFLNLEHVAPTTPEVETLFDSFFIDQLLDFQRNADPDTSREAVEQSYYNRPDKKENILAPVGQQCDWLRQIGFKDVDCFFKIFELALFGGRRKSTKSHAGCGK